MEFIVIIILQPITNKIWFFIFLLLFINDSSKGDKPHPISISGVSFLSAYFGFLISKTGFNFELYIYKHILLGEQNPNMVTFLSSKGLNLVILLTGYIFLYIIFPTVFLLKKLL